jgi:hypothetical protein
MYNGFICTLTMDPKVVASHPQGSRFLLQRRLVREWVDYLEALAASMPSRPPKAGISVEDQAAMALAKAWNKGVTEALKNIKASPNVESVAKTLLIVDQSSGKSGTAEYPSEQFKREVQVANETKELPAPE